MSEHGIIHSRSQGLIDFAYQFAKEKHKDQKRKYTGEPYIIHCVNVAKLVSSVTEDCDMIATAFLHDTVEDTDTTFEEIKSVGFGFTIANLVRELTDISKPEDGNRAKRKAMDREHIARASKEGKTIKLADLIDNSYSIIEYDKNFAVVYMREKKELLNVLQDGDKALFKIASDIVEQYYNITTYANVR